MSSSSTRKPCAAGNHCQLGAIFNCEGCSQAFCTKHAPDHRRLLGEEINGIISEHNHLQNTLFEQTFKPQLHLLIKQIDDWEQTSIAKVGQRANEARKELVNLTANHTNGLLKQLQEMIESLRQGLEYDAFIETDIRRWKETLDKLKSDCTSLSTIAIHQNQTVPLICDFSFGSKLSNDLFDRVFDNNVRIEENGQVAVHDSFRGFTEIRGKNEYTSGCHKVRLLIEASSNGWNFFGINSTLIPLKKRSQKSKSTNGWSSNNNSWSNGQPSLNYSNVRIAMRTNDVITLIFDCDNRTISMINERTKSKHKLLVNVDHCPLPWQLHINLRDPNDRIRILSA